MTLINTLKGLCSPALVYLTIEILILLSLVLQNVGSGNRGKLCVGQYSCDMANMFPFYLIKILYISFWTFILNLMCKGGYGSFAWFLVLLPIMLFFVGLGFFMVAKMPNY